MPNSPVTFKPDHFCIIVDDLVAATRNFEALGFIVTQGSNTGGDSANAFVIFQDGVYIELVRLDKPGFRKFLLGLTHPTGLMKLMFRGDKTFIRRFLRYWTVAPRGHWADWCLAAKPLDGAIAQARERGLDLAPLPYTHHRYRADGACVKWRMGGGVDPSLPFLIEDVEGYAERAPIRLGARHPNGAGRLAGVVLGSNDPSATLGRLESLTGAESADGVLLVGGVPVHIEHDPAFPMPLPKELILNTDDPDADEQRLDPALTGGALITLKRAGAE